MDTLVVLSTDTANFMAYSLTVSHELISMCGVQAATNTNRVRVLAGIQSLAYSAVGFEVERWNGNNNTWTSLDGYETDAVFTSVSAAGVPVTAAEEGYEYLSAFVVEDIDSSGVLRFTPYVVKNGSKMRGSSVIYSVQACYKNEDGVYADYESQASTVMTSKPDYNTVVVQTDLEMPDFDGYSVLNISSPFDGSFENASTILSEYSNSNYSTIINRKALFRYGGQASFTALKKTSGSKYRQPLTGEKALAFENISGQNSSTSGLDGKVKISNMLPDDACTEQNLGKTYKIAFYVYVDNLRTWVTSSSPYTHQPYSGDTVDVMVGLLDDTSTAALCTTKTVTLTRGKWNLVEYEFTVSKDILETLGTKAFSSSDATEVKVPARPFVSFGTPAVFAGDFYIDNMMVGWK